MIIKSIEINNFLSYSGKTEFRFDQGATLIIGQNNSGKSKLFDAYNWVLYNEAFKTTDEEWKDTSIWREELGNRMALNQCKINSSLEINVALEFEDGPGNLFLVTRSYRIKKLSAGEWECPSSATLQVAKTEAGTHNAVNLKGDEAERVLEQYFPKNLSRYFLLQGENISRLMRLNQRSDFTRAIGELSGIKFFKKAKIYARDVYERAKLAFDEKVEGSEAAQKEKERLTKEISDQLEEIEDVQLKLDNESTERSRIQTLLDEKISQLNKYEECAAILAEISEQEKLRDHWYQMRKVHYEGNRNILLSEWIYADSAEAFRSYLAMYRKAKNDKKIPEPIRQDFIREMLEAELCKVCGTHAPKGSSTYETILKHLNEQALDEEVALINALSDVADSMVETIAGVDLSVSAFQTELSNIQKEINKSRDLVSQKEDELRIVIEKIAEQLGTKVRREDVEKIDILQVKKDRDQFRNDLEKSKNKIAQLMGNMEAQKQVLEKLQLEYENLVNNSSNDIEKKRMNLALQVKDQVDKLHDNFLYKLINDIETEANEYFVSMTLGSEARSGRVRVNYQAEEVYVVDEQGTRLFNINQANRVSLQIAFVAAILSVSSKIWGNYFPFVSDAPISALGGNNKIGAIKTMIDIFRQSIIILKDDANTDDPESIKNDPVRQMISLNPLIKHGYELRMSVAESTSEQHTVVTKLK